MPQEPQKVCQLNRRVRNRIPARRSRAVSRSMISGKDVRRPSQRFLLTEVLPHDFCCRPAIYRLAQFRHVIFNVCAACVLCIDPMANMLVPSAPSHPKPNARRPSCGGRQLVTPEGNPTSAKERIPSLSELLDGTRASRRSL